MVGFLAQVLGILEPCNIGFLTTCLGKLYRRICPNYFDLPKRIPPQEARDTNPKGPKDPIMRYSVLG